MYAALWRVLPGTVGAKVVQLVALAVIVGAVLMAFVFPALAAIFLTEESTLGAP